MKYLKPNGRNISWITIYNIKGCGNSPHPVLVVADDTADKLDEILDKVTGLYKGLDGYEWVFTANQSNVEFKMLAETTTSVITKENFAGAVIGVFALVPQSSWSGSPLATITAIDLEFDVYWNFTFGHAMNDNYHYNSGIVRLYRVVGGSPTITMNSNYSAQIWGIVNKQQ